MHCRIFSPACAPPFLSCNIREEQQTIPTESVPQKAEGPRMLAGPLPVFLLFFCSAHRFFRSAHQYATECGLYL